MSEGRVIHGSRNGVQLLYYSGNIRYTIALALDVYITELLQQRGVKGFVVDLTSVETIDSTHLGILARLARGMQRAGLPRVTLVSNRPSVNEVLQGMGFQRVFHIVSESGAELERMREIPEVSTEDTEMMRLLLESHRALMELNNRNREQFRDVVGVFEAESEKGRGKT